MEILKTENFDIEYAKELQSYAIKALANAESKLQYFCKLFNCKKEDVGVLKASFFNKRNEFVAHIKKISGGSEPPKWAEGCFYNGEIQALVRKEVENERVNTLAHETVHLIFNKTIYNKFNIDRVRWLDESFAVYLDGEVDKQELQDIVKKLEPISNNFNMNDLEDVNKVHTSLYDGYNMFNVIGYYIFKNNLQAEMLNLLKTDRNKVVEIGTHILQDALDFLKGVEIY